MRTTSLLLASGLLAALLPVSTAVAASDPYADSTIAVSNQTYQPEYSLGALDEMYTTFLDQDAYLTFDMGDGESGTGDLTLYTQLLNFGAMYRVEFLDEGQLVIETHGDFVPNYTSTVTVDYMSTAPYRYVRVTSTEEEQWKLDAIEAASVVTPQEEETPPAEEEPPAEEPAPEEESDLSRGLLVKLVDDGDANTTVDSAVYVLDGDGGRHAFPSETIFFTWYADYETLAFIDSTNLASYQLRENVTVRPGTYLVKITTDPKVYAVEPGRVLRWVTSEEVAEDLYGSNWASRVIDVPDVFFNDYEIGDPIQTAIHPTGTIGYPPTGEIVYIENGVSYTVGGLWDDMRFQSNFLVAIDEAVADMYVDGGDLSPNPDIQWPY